MSPNLPASIHRRLLNQAHKEGRPFNELLQHYALDRFLYRLGESPYRSRFVLKGALVLAAWHPAIRRPTRDIDLLGEIEHAPEFIATVMQSICRQPVANDGLVFDAESVIAQSIMEAANYAGVRVRFYAYLGKARIPMQIDIGFADALIPGPVLTILPPPLDLPAAEVLGYTPESVVAEKLQIMAALGELNSRLKDYYDLWLLATHREFDGAQLTAALSATFTRRRTPFAWPLVALGEAFAHSHADQWQVFMDRQRLAEPASLSCAIVRIATFAEPPISAVMVSREFTLHWPPGGPWQ